MSLKPLKQTKRRRNTKPLVYKNSEKQLETVADKIISPKLPGFTKRHSSQNALLNLLNNWQKCLGTSGVVEPY